MTLACSARSPEPAQERRAAQLWEATKAAYAARATYLDQGEVEIVELGGEPDRAHFVTTFRGRNDLRFEFTSAGVTGRADRSTIVVRDGRVSIVEDDGVKQSRTVEEKSSIDEAAWTLSGSSHLTSRIVPLLLYARDFCQDGACSEMRYLGLEVVEGRHCHKIEMNSNIGRHMWFWTDQQDNLLRRVELAFAPSEEHRGFKMSISYVVGDEARTLRPE